MALRKIINYLNHDVLRKKSKTVEAVDHKTLVLLRDMAETMYAANGAGLAAVQVGILRRMVVIDDGTGLIKLINPVIVEATGEQEGYEGCLSIPGICGRVKRPERVIVHATDERGLPVKLEGKGFLSRAFCHEIDHLDGILYIDRATPGSIINQKDLEAMAADKQPNAILYR